MENVDSALVSRVYDTVLDPLAWPSVLQDVAETLGGRGALTFEIMQFRDSRTLISPIASGNYDIENVNQYIRKFNDNEIAEQEAFAELSGTAPNIQLINDDEALPEYARVKRENLELLEELGIKHYAGAVMNKDCWTIDRFALQFAKNRKGASAEEKEKAALLLPHVAKALRIGRPLIRAGIEGAGIQAGLEDSDFGISAVLPQGDLIFANAEFERILQDHPVFMLARDGRLKLQETAQSNRFRSLVSDQKAHGRAGANPKMESLTFPVGGGALFVEIVPAEKNPDLGLFPAGASIVTVLDSSKPHRLKLAAIERFFNFSPAEQEITELIGNGLSNSEIADHRGRSTETVNSQVKGLLRKTLCKNRTELIHLALSLDSPFSMRWAS